jgi:hypothetical protein
LCESLNGVLVQSRTLVGELVNLPSQFHFYCSSSGNKPTVSGQDFEIIDSIINGSLNIVEEIVSSSTNDDGSDTRFFLVLTENDDCGVSKLVGVDVISVTNFLSRRWSLN